MKAYPSMATPIVPLMQHPRSSAVPAPTPPCRTGSRPAGREIVRRNVDAHVEPRLACGVSRVVVRRPLEGEVAARPHLDLERAARDRNLVEAAREVRAAGEPGEHLRGRPAEGAVAGDVAREGRCHERRQLVRDPVDSPDPPNTARLCGRILGEAGPGVDVRLAAATLDEAGHL